MSDTLPNEVREAVKAAMREVRYHDTEGQIDAALSALEAAGWVCVPVEPTSDMVEYGRQDALNPASLDWMELGYRHGRNTMYAPSLVRRIWERMIAATPLTASNPKEKPMGPPQDSAAEGSK